MHVYHGTIFNLLIGVFTFACFFIFIVSWVCMKTHYYSSINWLIYIVKIPTHCASWLHPSLTSILLFVSQTSCCCFLPISVDGCVSFLQRHFSHRRYSGNENFLHMRNFVYADTLSRHMGIIIQPYLCVPILLSNSAYTFITHLGLEELSNIWVWLYLGSLP